MFKYTMERHRRPEERPWVDEVHDLARRSVENPMVRAILDSIEGLVMILDSDRRVLAANPELLECLDLHETDSLIGKLPGQTMGCIHADENPLGCGNAAACTQCGTLFAILASQERNGPVPAECCLSIRRGERLEAREFQVRATPLVMGAHRLTVLVLQDISARKRREVLESLFFHDVRDAVQGITAWSEALEMAVSDPQGVARKILALSLRLNEQVAWKHRLFQAEAGTLGLKMEQAPVKECFVRLRALFESSDLMRGHTLEIEMAPDKAMVQADLDVLMQILGDMVTNALEATPAGGMVRVRWEPGEGAGRFIVHNPGAMEESVALRVFQRTFTTKPGSGRGLGTYSMKILGENLLGGHVSFRSTPDEGTAFTFELSREGRA